MESACTNIAEEPAHLSPPIQTAVDARQRNALLLFPPGVRLPEGWQAPWIQAGWNVSNCSGSDRIPAALHGPGASALIASPWAEVGKPSLRNTVARGLKVLEESTGPLRDIKPANTASAAGMLRRSDFLARLSQVIATPPEACCILVSVIVDQAAALTTSLKRTAIFELEEKISQRLAAVLQKSDAMTIWLEFGFGILLQRADSKEILEQAEQICTSIASKPFLIDGEPRSLTVSTGLALPPRESRGDGAHQWFASAYAAQGMASRHGGNRNEGVLSRDYEPMPAERVLIIREWVQDAKSGTNIMVEFQPLMPMSADAGELYSVHAKLRDYRDPLGGVYRREYLRIAREAGAMIMIDRTCLFHAFETLQQEFDRGRSTRLLVPIELDTLKDLPWRWFEAELKRRRHLADRLTVEIEASPVLLDKDSIKRIVRLRHYGVRVGLSDPRERLDQVELWSKLPLDTLQLQHQAAQALTDQQFRAALHPWRSKGRHLIVDSVEDVDAVSRLSALGVDHLRGNALAEIGPRLDYDFSAAV
ncbi:bifunctional diguanylate cyclase/phosphodiesterase [Dokdonella sp.]|uniref:bifunctional diguanylate cyclase/phosphodiesterase n=1 Tax=Dokdonella sp. TaxID=2291710 RepID=UPI003C531021